MYVFDKERLNKYKKQDVLLEMLLNNPSHVRDLVCHKWLENSLPKRAFSMLYTKDLLFERKDLKILDIGGRLAGPSIELTNRHEYDPRYYGT